jgi:hypothetical protein
MNKNSLCFYVSKPKDVKELSSGDILTLFEKKERTSQELARLQEYVKQGYLSKATAKRRATNLLANYKSALRINGIESSIEELLGQFVPEEVQTDVTSIEQLVLGDWVLGPVEVES